MVLSKHNNKISCCADHSHSHIWDFSQTSQKKKPSVQHLESDFGQFFAIWLLIKRCHHSDFILKMSFYVHAHWLDNHWLGLVKTHAETIPVFRDSFASMKSAPWMLRPVTNRTDTIRSDIFGSPLMTHGPSANAFVTFITFCTTLVAAVVLIKNSSVSQDSKGLVCRRHHVRLSFFGKAKWYNLSRHIARNVTTLGGHLLRDDN